MANNRSWREFAYRCVEMARGRGLEPRLEAPKAPVLPLDDPRTVQQTNSIYLYYQTMALQPIKKFYRTQARYDQFDISLLGVR